MRMILPGTMIGDDDREKEDREDGRWQVNGTVCEKRDTLLVGVKVPLPLNR